MNTKPCPYCREPLHPEARFCPACMKKLEAEQEVPISKTYHHGWRKWVLLLCAMILTAGIVSAWYIHSTVGEAQKNVTAWTMKLRPNGGVDSFAFCQEHGIVGFGWGLDGNPETITEYRSIRTQEGAYPGDTLLNTTLDYFENMTTADYVNLVWVCDSEGYYYICEITGPYQYNRDDAHETAGIVNFASCTFYRVGFEDLVPQPVLDALEKDGVIRFVGSAGATEATGQLWEMLKK